MSFSPQELALKAQLDHTGVPAEVGARIAKQSGLGAARAVRVLHAVLGLSVEEITAVVRREYARWEPSGREEDVGFENITMDAPPVPAWAGVPMRRANFEVADSMIEFGQDGRWYDLHNAFDFTSLTYDVTARTLRLSWVRSPRYGSSEDPATLELRFNDVDYLVVHPRDPDMPPDEDLTLEHVGYLSPDLLGQAEWFVNDVLIRTYDHPVEQYPMLIAFHGGQRVVVHAREISLHVGDSGEGA
ncbi:hypothetical protein [Deinococcus pimensis]|uniref:hypothetical protein n=1 Tax=Deinococcus pimensis TaxID=309888 RepID=UPI000480728D|nr:hypothetical protein [Deinococcus pimensis]